MIKGFIEIPHRLYQGWIDDNVPRSCKQLCRCKAEEMVKAFPELRVVGIHGIYSGHAWCVTVGDTVVDPTAHQFEGVQYPYDDEARIDIEDFPLGKCPWCGEITWPATENNKKRFGGTDELLEHEGCGAVLEQYRRDVEKEYADDFPAEASLSRPLKDSNRAT